MRGFCLIFVILMSVGAGGCRRSVVTTDAPTLNSSSGTPKFKTTIEIPEGLGALATGQVNAVGKPVEIQCSTCHTEGSPPAKDSRFHTRERIDHGPLSCAHCHASDNRALLHLANGEPIAMRNAMELCAQCHGSQYRDYQHGSHGGMRGYWDLSRGPRQRHHCITCHNPHRPQFRSFIPAPGPKPRVRGGGHE